MSNPFEEPDTNYSVLRNEEEQLSLWPTLAPVPEGWTVVHGPGERDECLAYVKENWTDLRPRSVADFLSEQAA
jgi:MbtH protein